MNYYRMKNILNDQYYYSNFTSEVWLDAIVDGKEICKKSEELKHSFTEVEILINRNILEPKFAPKDAIAKDYLLRKSFILKSREFLKQNFCQVVKNEADKFGVNLKRIRLEKECSMGALSRLSKVGVNIISSYESLASKPSYESIIRLCKALDVTPNDLMQ